MRKMSVVLLAAMFLAGVSGVLADDVKSVNAVGYVKTQIPDGRWALISLPFMTMDEDVTFTINDIIPADDDLIGTKAWYYRGDLWQPEHLQNTPGGAEWSPGTNEFLRGQDALFVKADVAGGGDLEITVLGEVPGDNNLGQTTTVVVAGDKWTCLGFGYPVDVLVTNTELNTKGLQGDTIWTWDPDSGAVGAWAKVTEMVNTPGGVQWSPADEVLNAGQGYFYDRNGALMNWIQNKLYDEP